MVLDLLFRYFWFNPQTHKVMSIILLLLFAQPARLAWYQFKKQIWNSTTTSRHKREGLGGGGPNWQLSPNVTVLLHQVRSGKEGIGPSALIILSSVREVSWQPPLQRECAQHDHITYCAELFRRSSSPALHGVRYRCSLHKCSSVQTDRHNITFNLCAPFCTAFEGKGREHEVMQKVVLRSVSSHSL